MYYCLDLPWYQNIQIPNYGPCGFVHVLRTGPATGNCYYLSVKPNLDERLDSLCNGWNHTGPCWEWDEGGRGSVSSSCWALVFYMRCLHLLSHTITQSSSTQAWVREDARLIALQPDASVVALVDVLVAIVPLTFRLHHSLPGKRLNRNVVLTGLHYHTRWGVCFMFSVEFLNVILVCKNKHLFVWAEGYLTVSHWHFSRGHRCFHRHLLTIVCCLLNSLSVHKEEGKQGFSHFCDIPLLTPSPLFLQPSTKKGTWDVTGLVKPSTY